MSTNNSLTYLNLKCLEVDYKNSLHTQALLRLLQVYATDPMGGAEPISAEILDTLIFEIAKRPHVFSVLVFGEIKAVSTDATNPTVNASVPIAFANCIESFSTFKGKAVVNIHDFAVIPEARGQGVSQRLLTAIENIANARGACKLTLEVLEGNKAAQNAYIKAGFSGYELDPALGRALFWEKML